MVIKPEKGETLATLAMRYHTSVEKIMADNALPAVELHTGVRLWIVGYLWHVWMPEDTVESVSARYGVPADVVRGANDRYAVGLRIKIPIE